MWNVEERFSPKAIESLAALGFAVGSTRGVVRVEKYGCGAEFRALATHLQNLRKFNEELRTALGVPTFYNEALGSVSQVSVYDRVKGRKGAVPDETVGAHEAGGGH